MSQEIPDLNQFMPPGWQGKYPPCQIQVNPNGELSHDGAPMIHPGILELIYDSVHLEDGVYYLEMDGKRCQLEVEDTFFVVQSVEMGDEAIKLHLSGGTNEELDPESLWVGTGDVLYCRVKKSVFPARFLRKAYYQIAEKIEPQGDGFALVLGSRSFELRTA